MRKAYLLAIGLIPLAACGVVALFCYQILYTTTYDIASIDFGEGYHIRLFVEAVGLQDPRWDPDHGNNSTIYYEITQSNRVIVPTTFLTVNFSSPFHLQTAFAEDGNLVAVYDTEYWDYGLFILFDVKQPERWHPSSFTDEERQRWIDRYERLKAANPDLPNVFRE